MVLLLTDCNTEFSSVFIVVIVVIWIKVLFKLMHQSDVNSFSENQIRCLYHVYMIINTHPYLPPLLGQKAE